MAADFDGLNEAATTPLPFCGAILGTSLVLRALRIPMSATALYAPSARPLTQLACERPAGQGEWGPAAGPGPPLALGPQHCGRRSGVRPSASPLRPAERAPPRRVDAGLSPRRGSGVPAPERGVWVPLITAASFTEPLPAAGAGRRGQDARPPPAGRADRAPLSAGRRGLSDWPSLVRPGLCRAAAAEAVVFPPSESQMGPKPNLSCHRHVLIWCPSPPIRHEN